MTAAKTGKGRRAPARRSAADPAPQDDRLDRLEAMMSQLSDHLYAVTGVAAASKAPVEAGADPDQSDAEDVGEVKAAKERERQRVKDEAEAAGFVSTLIEPRHREIFDWLCNVQGKSEAQLVKELLRSSLVKEKAAFREAMGGGGASSRNLASLAERLPPR